MPNRTWLMWGWIDPKKRLAPQLVVRRQGVYSETNYNLLLEPESQHESRLSDFELGQLLTMLGGQLPPHGPARLLEEGCLSSLCEKCRKESSSPCQLFVKPWPHGWTREVPFPGGVRSLMQREVGPCLIRTKLADMTETRSQRRFYELYFEFAFQRARRRAGEALEEAVVDLSSTGLPTAVGGEEWAQSLWRDLMATLTVPALLPQAVVNLVRCADVPSEHPELHFLERNVVRVDFVFVHEGQRHIVEIDGPVRRATEVSHARRLHVDRALRHQEWRIHRFSDLEVKGERHFEGFAWELGFPSRLYASLKDSSGIAADDGVQPVDP